MTEKADIRNMVYGHGGGRVFVVDDCVVGLLLQLN
jgi:hypothetical protein